MKSGGKAGAHYSSQPSFVILLRIGVRIIDGLICSVLVSMAEEWMAALIVMVEK